MGNYAKQGQLDKTIELVEQHGGVVFQDEGQSFPLVHLGEGEFLYLPGDITIVCERLGQQSIVTVGAGSRYIRQ